MRSKLQDQLLKAGLANQQQAKVINKSKKKQQSKPSPQETQAQRAAQAERDRQLNEQRKQEAERKERQAQIRQIITQHALPVDPKADLGYHFAQAGKVKRLYVTQELIGKLERGQLAVTCLDERHLIISTDAADKIRARDPDYFIHQQSKPQQPDEDDPYADYQIPDDLMW